MLPNSLIKSGRRDYFVISGCEKYKLPLPKASKLVD